MTRSFAAMKRAANGVKKLLQRALHGCVARPQTKVDADETTEVVELEWDHAAFTLLVSSTAAPPAVQETSFAHIHDHDVDAAPPIVPSVRTSTVDAPAHASLAATTQAAAAAAQHAVAAVLAAPLKPLKMSGALVYPAWQNLKGAAEDHGRACTEYHVQLRACVAPSQFDTSRPLARA
jgi:hypothetical protein